MRKYSRIFVIILAISIIGCGLRSEEKPKVKSSKKVDYIPLAMEQLAQKNLTGAFKNFDNAIKQEPRNLTNYVLLSQVYFKLEQYDRSVDTLSAALQLDPKNGELYFLISQSLAQQEKRKEAIAAAQRSVEMFIAKKNEPGLRKAVTFLRALTGEDQTSAQ